MSSTLAPILKAVRLVPEKFPWRKVATDSGGKTTHPEIILSGTKSSVFGGSKINSISCGETMTYGRGFEGVFGGYSGCATNGSFPDA